jgi:O-antigen/teichoic acid export membrane protein
MHTLRALFKNTIANYCGGVIDIVAGLASIALIARYLTIKDFGTYCYIIAVLTVVKQFVGLGIPAILTRESAQDQNKAAEYFLSSFTIILLSSIIVFIILNFLVRLLPFAEYALLINLCFISLTVDLFSRLCTSIFRSFERMHYDAIKTSLVQFTHLTTIILVIKLDYRMPGLFVALLLANLSGFLYGFVIVNLRFTRIRLSLLHKYSKYIFLQALPLGIKSIIRRLNRRTSVLLLGLLKSTSEVAIFQGANKIINNLINVSESFSIALFPVLSKYYGTDDDKAKLAFEKSFKYMTIIGLFVAIAITHFSDEIVSLILSKKYLQSIPVLKILGWVFFINFLNNLQNKLLIAYKKQHLIVNCSVAGFVCNLGLSILLIPIYGYIGAAIACIVAEVVMFILTQYYVFTKVFKIYLKKIIFKAFFAGTAVSFFLFYTKGFDMLITLPAGFSLYAILLLLMGIVHQDEKELLWNTLRRRT